MSRARYLPRSRRGSQFRVPLDYRPAEASGGGLYPAGINDAGHVAGSYSYCNTSRENPDACKFNQGRWCHNVNVSVCGTAGFEAADGKSIPIYSPRATNACLLLNAINDADVMVGYICSKGKHSEQGVVVVGKSVMVLQSLVPRASAWSIGPAIAVNDPGTIVGYGMHDGQPHSYMLMPR